MINEDNSVEYTVKTLLSTELSLCAVVVTDKDGRIISLAHLVGPETLPGDYQLDFDEKFSYPTLSSVYERAMIVSNKRGNFAAIVGKWSGFRKTDTSDGQILNPGFLAYKFHDLQKNQVYAENIPSSERTTSVTLGGIVTADLRSNIISLGTVDHVGDHLASIFATSMLFVLCNPDKIRHHQEQARRSLGCQNWPLVIAAGYGHIPNIAEQMPINEEESMKEKDTDSESTDTKSDINRNIIGSASFNSRHVENDYSGETMGRGQSAVTFIVGCDA